MMTVRSSATLRILFLFPLQLTGLQAASVAEHQCDNVADLCGEVNAEGGVALGGVAYVVATAWIAEERSMLVPLALLTLAVCGL
jgi:hypothetical protein